MARARQIAANRRNAQRNTGPRSPEAKARVSHNAISHGLTARDPVLPGEDPAEYSAHCQFFFHHYRPASPVEEQLVRTIADAEWRSHLSVALERNHLFTDPSDAPSFDDLDPEGNFKILHKLSAYEARFAGRSRRALQEFHQLQATHNHHETQEKP